MEPERRHDVEAHHRAELRAVAEEHGEIRSRAQCQQHDHRQRVEWMHIAALDRIERPLAPEHDHVEGHESVAEQARQDREGHDLVERRAKRENKRNGNQEHDRPIRRAIDRVHRPEPARQVAVAAHREPGP